MMSYNRNDIRKIIWGSEKMVCYKDLSGWLKVAIIGGWISLVINGIAFIIGFMEGLL